MSEDMRGLLRRVDSYVEGLFAPPDPALEGALRRSRAAGLPEINVSPNEGKLLRLLAEMVGARRILEIGTLGGYSAIHLARVFRACRGSRTGGGRPRTSSGIGAGSCVAAAGHAAAWRPARSGRAGGTGAFRSA